MKLSLVIPVHNEEDNLQELFAAIQDSIIPLQIEWEVTFVDDGSLDNSYRVLKEIVNIDPQHVQVISLKRQAGQTAAINCWH
jgi:dolichol-phosphate mannosyltransferase